MIDIGNAVIDQAVERDRALCERGRTGEFEQPHASEGNLHFHCVVPGYDASVWLTTEVALTDAVALPFTPLPTAAVRDGAIAVSGSAARGDGRGPSSSPFNTRCALATSSVPVQRAITMVPTTFPVRFVAARICAMK